MTEKLSFIIEPLYNLLNWIHNMGPTLGRFHHPADHYRANHPDSADRKAVHLHAGDAKAAAQDQGAAGAVQG